MSIEMENARKLVECENRAKAAIRELDAVSMLLMGMNKDLKLSSWDWNRPGYTASIMPQGQVTMAIIDIKDRPS